MKLKICVKIGVHLTGFILWNNTMNTKQTTVLTNPNKHIVIRHCPLNKGYVACDQLNAKGKFIKQLDDVKTDSLDRAFAIFANRGIIEPVGFYENDSYYWGNSK